ncbi:MAG: glycosyltransferase family 39 protein [Bacteroidales bacterium]|nr:glycosyltransferase family 39 protein [Bacteroidales bacterium]MCF8403005.1 glycosyltransferase family 39 protein [Bacteroidales bacterium]
MRSNQFPFWILTITVFCALTLPLMVQEGMFTDGVLYSAVAHNLANGIGSFWFPKFDSLGFAGLENFHEHPPLYFSIQATFFRFLGSGFFVEKLHSLLAAILTALLIAQVWKKINEDREDFRKLLWLPIMYWIIIPIAFYSVQNNLIEGTMSIFMMASLLFFLKATSKNSHQYFYLLISGFFIFLASFTKGLPGLFPLAIPGFYWLIKRKINLKKAVIYTLLMFTVPLVIYGIIFLFSPEGKESLTIYINSRLLGRISNRPTVTYRGYIMEWLFYNMLPLLGISAIILLIERFKSFRKIFNPDFGKDILFFIAIGLSGVMPLMLTMVQKSFYFVHALPFFAIGFSLLVAPVLSKWINRDIKLKVIHILNTIFIIGLITTLTYTAVHIGKRGRDRELLYDVHLLAGYIPEGSIVRIDKKMHENWAAHSYFSRYYFISLNPRSVQHQYLLLDKGLSSVKYPSYRKMDIALKTYNLFELSEHNDQSNE